MSYAIYKTDAIVMRTIPHGEASTDVVFFTRDMGKVLVRAQSARKPESKMRMHLTRYGLVSVDMVRGRAVWRLTGVSPVRRSGVFGSGLFLVPVHRTMRLAEFLIQGEDAHPDLFDFFVGLLSYAEEASLVRAPAKDEADGLELFGVIKVLEKLGYWNGPEFPDAPSPEALVRCAADRKSLVKLINESISMTQIVVS